ncbi:MAG: hypothetical protein GWP56_04950 [Gammaproteobacteria bacterium]|jgi:hypothetical protein|nr:hypothetical protein [Gammaproteobacteria bacterium]
MKTDITPLTALKRLCEKDKTDHSLLTDISRTLGLKRNRNQSEQWKQKLRGELTQEHIEMKQKKNSSFRTKVHKLFKRA